MIIACASGCRNSRCRRPRWRVTSFEHNLATAYQPRGTGAVDLRIQSTTVPDAEQDGRGDMFEYVDSSYTGTSRKMPNNDYMRRGEQTY